MYTILDNKIEQTEKDFLFFSINKFDEIEKYIITNDYNRYKNKYNNFISIEKAKNIQINQVCIVKKNYICIILTYKHKQMKIKLSFTSMAKIRKSTKTFMLYRLNQQEDKIVDFVLTDNLSRFRDKYNNKFKLVTDIKKSINNFKISL